MNRVVIATTNPGKLREIRRILGHLPAAILSLRDFPPVAEPDETGVTFEENARLKALYYDAAVASAAAPAHGGPLCTVAEDSGLVIDALGGAPGVQSARFLGPDASYPERFEEIFRRLAAYPGAPRTARFVCALALVQGGSVIFETTGVVEGDIAAAPRGERGFGYDPIMYFPPYGRTLAEATDEEKERVGHRGQAFRRLAQWLEGRPVIS
ncbi:MAG: RdgB/HAM1 family non-canonical purine NTP pyrophosphatase [Acidobacteria bacterium]|nr:RdgB/HAM1 family non-canonical purine NTP pyrophosphatase [Acidobacteriota bacterium]